MPHCPFVTLDVFTTERFGGNPLAVIFDAEDLSDAQMQQVAKEFGYSEITFVLPPDDPAHTAKVRIFTPVTEVPFAGHPNVGTAHAIGSLPDLFGRPVGDRLVFEEKAGLVEVTLERAAGIVTSAEITAPGPLQVGAAVPVGTMAGCLSPESHDILSENHPPRFVSVGLKFILVEVAGLDALARARVDLAALQALRDAHPDEQCDCATFVYARTGREAVRARMFAPFDNVAEDPATGSASAALGAYLASLVHADGETRLSVVQGVEMGRPSHIFVKVESHDGLLRSVRVSGSCVTVMRGTIEV